MAIISLGCLLGVVGAPAPAHAQSGEDSAPSRQRLAGQMELPRLADLAAQRLHVNIDYDPQALKGQAALRLEEREEGLSDVELWRVFNRVLAARGFTTVRASGPELAAFSIVRITDAAGLAPIEEPAGPAPSSSPIPGYMARTYRARFRPAPELAELLTKGLGKSGGAGGGLSVAPLGDSDLLLVSDLTPRLEQTFRLLQAIDTPVAHSTLEEVRLTSLGGAQMASLVAQVIGGESPPATPGVAGVRPNTGGMGGAGATVIPGPDPGGVLIIATPDRMQSLKALIHRLDARDAVVTRTYSPRHFAAKDVARLIEQAVRLPGSTGTGGRGPTGAEAGTGAEVGGVDDRFRIVVDDLAGGLIISASPVQHERIAALIDRLDRTPASARRPVRSFVVKNRPVKEVQAILEDLLRAGILGAETAGQDQIPATPPSSTRATERGSGITLAPPPVRTAGPDHPVAAGSPSARSPTPIDADQPAVVLTADEGTNTLIALGEPRVLDQVQALLKDLDVRQAQVLLEVLMLTLTEGQTLDLGVELESITMSGDLRIRLSSLFGLGIRGAGGDRDGPSNASGFTGVVLSPGDFSVVIRALQTLNSGRSLSIPRLLVSNNQSASFDSVVQQPFASVNASNTVSTTSFGGTQDAGTVVTIKPRIAEGDHLLLEYSVSLSAFLGSASSETLPPPRQQNRVQSVATIPDGFTVVVGGIEVQTQSKTTAQVPFIGSLPFVGELFKNRNNQDSRSRFYVFVRPTILRQQNFEDLKYASEVSTSSAGIDDGLPEVLPRIIP